jgi:glutathione synthase/RimK-type ligase-like ATP-grasp enzyme
MSRLIVTDNVEDWPAKLDGAQVVAADEYLTQSKYADMRGVKLFNLCRSYRYQTTGYYVSLLAEARNHKVLPSITTIEDLRNAAMVRLVSDELDELIQRSLHAIKAETFTLSIYLGRNMAKRYDPLCRQLFNQFQAPLMRAQFALGSDARWQLSSIKLIAAKDIPPSHSSFVVDSLGRYFSGRQERVRRNKTRFDLAILVNPNEQQPPSNEKALKKFARAAESLGMAAEFITADDFAHLAEFDALFIRETTAVNHHTYRFARRAAREGLVVMDDPQSIVRCTNKVYLAELLARNKIPTPETLVVNRGNVHEVAKHLGFPLVLKQPDSSFSMGVVKVADELEYGQRLEEYFDKSGDLLVAQQFLPTTFDWRIGIVDRQPIYAAKYFMARNHWQIIRQDTQGSDRYGRFETIPIELAPRKAVAIAVKAANLIGDGFYGVDVKESNGHFYIIEVNDNPSIDSGCEDVILKDELYRRVMAVFLRRVEQMKAGWPT